MRHATLFSALTPIVFALVASTASADFSRTGIELKESMGTPGSPGNGKIVVAKVYENIQAVSQWNDPIAVTPGLPVYAIKSFETNFEWKETLGFELCEINRWLNGETEGLVEIRFLKNDRFYEVKLERRTPPSDPANPCYIEGEYHLFAQQPIHRKPVFQRRGFGLENVLIGTIGGKNVKIILAPNYSSNGRSQEAFARRVVSFMVDGQPAMAKDVDLRLLDYPNGSTHLVGHLQNQWIDFSGMDYDMKGVVGCILPSSSFIGR